MCSEHQQGKIVDYGNCTRIDIVLGGSVNVINPVDDYFYLLGF